MRDIVVIGASAGGVAALQQLVAGFPADWTAAVFVVLHVPPDAESELPAILGRAGPLPAAHAVDGAAITPGTITVAPPDQHLMLLDDRVRLARGPRQNRARPSVDVLFRSAALTCGPRVIGAVLTGGLSDGSAGLRAVRSRGGVAIVQDPRDAAFSSMPTHALAVVQVDHCVPISEMAALMVKRSNEPAPREAPPPSQELEMEVRHDQGDLSIDLDRIGSPSYFTCPECHGTLWEIRDGEILRYRCRVGHGYSAEGLAEHMDETMEDTLWAAVRSLIENAHFKERVAERLEGRDRHDLSESLRAQAGVTRRRAETIRALLTDPGRREADSNDG